MSNSKIIALAAVVSTALTLQTARAADLPAPYFKAPIVEEFGGWYLRGDVGWSNQEVRSLWNVLYTTSTVTNLNKGFEVGGIFGLGVGYQFNNWIRVDVTGEFRSGSTFHGLDRYVGIGFAGTDEYTAIKSEWLFLANVYVDLGTWKGITPYVGAGVGFSRNTISNFLDVNTPNAGVAFAAAASKWNLAWALHAGLAYRVTPNFLVDLSYRYVSLGDAITGDIIAYDGTNPSVNPMHFRGLTSHDVRLGVRWFFDEGFAPPPLIRKG
jgi:opacity protein-like surface antigen